jgi:hypothetical protein
VAGFSLEGAGKMVLISLINLDIGSLDVGSLGKSFVLKRNETYKKKTSAQSFEERKYVATLLEKRFL